MLGQPVSMLVPQVVGFKLSGSLKRRGHGHRPRADRHRATPPQGGRRQVRRVLRRRPGDAPPGRPRDDRQHGPRIRGDLRDLPDRRRDLALPRTLRKPPGADPPGRGLREGPGALLQPGRARGVVHRHPRTRPGRRSSPAWPGRSGPRTASLGDAKESFRKALKAMHDVKPPARSGSGGSAPASTSTTDAKGESRLEGRRRRRDRRRRRGPQRAPAAAYRPLRHGYVEDGSVVIAAITSCTNTSNPSVMIAAGLVAKKAVERGLTTQPWVKASLAPGSKVVTDYLDDAGLTPISTSCGSTWSATAAPPASATRPAQPGDLQGDPRRRPRDRGRPQRQPELRRADQLRRPRQLPGLAAAGRRLRDRRDDGHRPRDRPDRPRPHRPGRLPQGHLADPEAEVADAVAKSVRAEMFHKEYGDVFKGDERWNSLPVPTGRPLRVGRQLDLRQEPALLHRDAGAARAGRGDPGGEGPGRPGRQHHHRPHLARRLDQGPGAGRPLPDRARRCRSPSSTPTARAGGTTR